MKFQNKIKLLTLMFAGLAAVSTAQAEEVSVDASVTVSNAIDLTVNSPLDFGTIAAFANSNTTPDLATFVMPADPAGTPTITDGDEARIISLIPGSPADVSVAGAAPNTVLTVTTTAADATLTDPAGIAIAPNGFTMGSFTRYAYLEGNGQTFGTTTDATGALGLNIGATLSTVTPAGGGAADVKVPYGDATYTGSFEVTINY